MADSDEPASNGNTEIESTGRHYRVLQRMLGSRKRRFADDERKAMAFAMARMAQETGESVLTSENAGTTP